MHRAADVGGAQRGNSRHLSARSLPEPEGGFRSSLGRCRSASDRGAPRQYLERMNEAARVMLSDDLAHDRNLTREEALALVDCDLEALLRAAARRRDARAWPDHLLFAQGLHSADPALPRRLPLLHVRASAAQGRARLSLARRGARDRAGRPGGGMQGGAVHARRQAGAALPRRRATSSPASDIATTLSYLARSRSAPCSTRPACCRTSIPGI